MTIALRPYQQSAIAAVQADWHTYSDVLVVMATGLGKTAVACALIDDLARAKPDARFLFMAHRQELIEQPRDRMLSYFPAWQGRIGIVMADNNDCDKPLTIATVQTLSSARRLTELLASGPIDYLITDETHHATADTYVNVYQTLRDCNPDLKHLGVTATPLRSDGAGLAQVFQHVAYKMGIREGVSQGWLVPPRWLAIQTGISLAGLPSHNGDYTQKRLADVYETANCFELVVKSHKEYAADRRALAFTSSVAGAHELARHFNEAGIKAAAADGTTAKTERADILSAFRRGDLQVLVNMGIYTEGLDVPEVSCIHQVRPTKSDALYTQILGRALRIVPGKEDALILDYCPIEARNIIMAGDVLGVDAKKEAYVKETQEPGAVVGGFTFDGSVKWLNGSPMELISRQLDYLHASPWVWDRGTNEHDWLILPLGKAGDEIERTLAMSPVSDSMALYLIAKRPDEHQAKAYRVKDGTFEELAAWAEDYAGRRGQASIAAKARQWRKQPPSDAQINFARRLRVFKPGMSKGDCANAITRALTLRALAAAGFIN